MTPYFKIKHFHSTAKLVNELERKLNRGGSEIAKAQAIDTNNISYDDQSCKDLKQICVLLIGKEDIEIFEKSGLSEIVQNTNSDFVFLGIDLPEDKRQTYTKLVSVTDSVEQIRRELIQYSNKRSRKNKYYYSFVGRIHELDQFQDLLYSNRFYNTKAVVVSGHSGIGREAFVRECIGRTCGSLDYEPYTISMGENSSVEMFMLQLNSILHEFGEKEFKERLDGDTQTKIETVVSQLNHLFENGDYLIVYDDSKSIIRYDRKAAEWFNDIITHPVLLGGMHLYVISTVAVNNATLKTNNGAVYITLYDLSFSDRRRLIYKCLSENSLVLPENDVQKLLDSSVYAPSILVKMIVEIKEKGWAYVKKHIEDYRSINDSQLHTLISNYETKDPEYDYEKWDLLVLLSKIEYLSEKVLRAIFPETFDIIQKLLESYVADGIVERFGEWLDYYRLDGSIREYMARSKKNYKDRSMEGHVKEVMSDMITGNRKITQDYSSYMYGIKEDINAGKDNRDIYLIPSIVVSTIIDTYDQKQWNKTIDLCELVLNERPHYFEEIYREIRYWYCLALARRERKESFDKNLEYFEGTADYYFLKGFFSRIEKQYEYAEQCFKKALSINPVFARAKRELVNALQRQHKFSEAFDLAKENYERDKNNSYHLLAYYRCYVRKPHLTMEDKKDIAGLKQAAEEMFKDYKDNYFIDGINFEYKRFVERANPESMLMMINAMEKKSSKAPYIEDIIGEYKLAQGLSSVMNVLPLDDEIDE